jgi:hypothetical protein
VPGVRGISGRDYNPRSGGAGATDGEFAWESTEIRGKQKDARVKCTSGRLSLLCKLVGGGWSFGRVNFDAALEIGAVFDADARRRNIAGDGAIPLDVDPAACVDVADNFPVGDHVASVNFGSELSGGTDGEFVTLESNGAFDDAVNLQVFRAGNLALDLDAGAEASPTAGRSTAEAAGRRRIEWNDWRYWNWRRRNPGWFRDSLLLRPHFRTSLK